MMNFNPNLATLKLKCNYQTQFGQVLRICGNIEELGCWDPTKSMIMTTTNETYPIWESTQEITGPVGMEISYKYVIHHESNNSFVWEALDSTINRYYKISGPGYFIITDQQNTLKSQIQTFPIDTNNENKYFDLELYDENDKLSDKNPTTVDNNINNYNSLLYDANNLNANDLNDTFFFCINVSSRFI
jgi:hypothetical protein